MAATASLNLAWADHSRLFNGHKLRFWGFYGRLALGEADSKPAL
jgi:hypothetical protein